MEHCAIALLENFGIQPLSDVIVRNAEEFLVRCIKKTDSLTFDELRYEVYHTDAFKLDLTKLPCTSSSIHEHIK